MQKPRYNRQAITSSIVHIGVGNFHRAHQAVYTDALLASGEHRWGITGVSLRSESVHDTLAPQDFFYTVKTQDETGSDPRLIGSICDVLALPQPGAREKIITKIADPKTHVVTLTITEKGYCHSADGQLDKANSNIIQDLQNPSQPQSAPGLLALAMKRRMELNAGPITLLSCDNLVNNGQVLSNVIKAMVHSAHPTAIAWLNENVTFPSSMVDRIVPQTKASDIEQLAQAAGYLDSGLVICEPFSQWVIEDNFAGARPAWDIGGAEFVAEVAPYEQAKLRLLNASHSALAYLGLLAGYTYIHQAMADPMLASFVRQLMDIEIEPTVAAPKALNLAEYKHSILTRFGNDAVPYTTAQVAGDGSQKLPQRIFPTILEQQVNGIQTPGLCLVVAGWLQSLTQHTADGSRSNISDPQAEPLLVLAIANPHADDFVRAIAINTRYFGSLSGSDTFLKNVGQALADLRQVGCLAAVAKLQARHSGR